MMGILNRLLGVTSKSLRPRQTVLNLECLEDRMALSPWLVGQTLSLQTNSATVPWYERSARVTITQQVRTPWLDNAPGIVGASGQAWYVAGNVSDPATGVNETVNGWMVDTGNGQSSLRLSGLGYNNTYTPAHYMPAFGTYFYIPGEWHLQCDTFQFNGAIIGNNAATAGVIGQTTFSEIYTNIWDSGYGPTQQWTNTVSDWYYGMA